MENISAIEDLIHRTGISMEVNQVGSNPIVPSESDSNTVEHYRCRLYKPGKQMDVYLSMEPGGDLITLPDVFFLLAVDASGCRMMEGLEQYREEWSSVFGGSDGNVAQLEEFWREYQARCGQTARLRQFLGDPEYEELLDHFQFEPIVDAVRSRAY